MVNDHTFFFLSPAEISTLSLLLDRSYRLRMQGTVLIAARGLHTTSDFTRAVSTNGLCRFNNALNLVGVIIALHNNFLLK
nr:MAG TPA: hypothetical protein [Caudoviricetes sp.]